jgi:hypothetical protein
MSEVQKIADEIDGTRDAERILTAKLEVTIDGRERNGLGVRSAFECSFDLWRRDRSAGLLKGTPSPGPRCIRTEARFPDIPLLATGSISVEKSLHSECLAARWSDFHEKKGIPEGIRGIFFRFENDLEKTVLRNASGFLAHRWGGKDSAGEKDTKASLPRRRAPARARHRHSPSGNSPPTE